MGEERGHVGRETCRLKSIEAQEEDDYVKETSGSLGDFTNQELYVF